MLLLVLAAIGLAVPFVVGSYLLQMASIPLIMSWWRWPHDLDRTGRQVSLQAPRLSAIGAYLVIIL